MDRPAARRERLLRTLRDEGIDGLLITGLENVRYLTGFTGDSSHLVLTPGRAVLVSDFRYTEQLAAECPGLELFVRPAVQPLWHATAEVVGKLGAASVGLEGQLVSVADFETLRTRTSAVQWKPTAGLVEKLRAVKDEAEVEQIRAAIEVAERAFMAFRALLRESDREKDLCDTLEAMVRRAGGSGTSFSPIVAVGDHSALPHAPVTARTVAEAEFLLVDWGAVVGGYRSDLTRMLAVHRISPKLEEVYAVVMKAREAALAAMRPGITAETVDAAARKVIADAGYGERFGHGLGHGIGLQIHEAPMLRPGSAVVLQEGMVVTVEPGIYLPGWGGVRVEDDVRITSDGCEVLARLPRDLASVALRG